MQYSNPIRLPTFNIWLSIIYYIPCINILCAGNIFSPLNGISLPPVPKSSISFTEMSKKNWKFDNKSGSIANHIVFATLNKKIPSECFPNIAYPYSLIVNLICLKL